MNNFTDFNKLSMKTAKSVVAQEIKNSKFQREKNEALALYIIGLCEDGNVSTAIKALDIHYQNLIDEVHDKTGDTNPLNSSSYGQNLSANFRNNCGNKVATFLGFERFSTDIRKPEKDRFYCVKPKTPKQVTAAGKNNAPDGSSIVAADMATSAEVKYNMDKATGDSDNIAATQSPLVGIRSQLLQCLTSGVLSIVDVELMVESLKAELADTAANKPVVLNTEVA